MGFFKNELIKANFQREAALRRIRVKLRAIRKQEKQDESK